MHRPHPRQNCHPCPRHEKYLGTCHAQPLPRPPPLSQPLCGHSKYARRWYCRPIGLFMQGVVVALSPTRPVLRLISVSQTASYIFGNRSPRQMRKHWMQVRTEILGAVLAGICWITPDLERYLQQRRSGRGRAALSVSQGTQLTFLLTQQLSDSLQQVCLPPSAPPPPPPSPDM